jgi:hypothetical protein
MDPEYDATSGTATTSVTCRGERRSSKSSDPEVSRSSVPLELGFEKYVLRCSGFPPPVFSLTLQLSSLVRAKDATWKFVGLSFVDPDAVIADELLAFVTALGRFDLLATE